MSITAPWLALAVDWDESEMWDSLPQYGFAEESTMGERLAFICLVCEAKKKGRGGKVSLRKSVFAKAHRLTRRAVDGMLSRAQKCGAVEINGDFVTLCNWKTYQEKTGGKRHVERTDSPESTEKPATKDTSPRTKDQGHITKDQGPSACAARPTLADVQAYVTKLGYTMDAEQFWHHFEARGWRTREGPLKNWKSAVVNWQKNEAKFGGNRHGTTRLSHRHQS